MNKENNIYICIDFDGTIVDHCYPDIGKPVHNAIMWIKEFQKIGAKIILWTMRSNNSTENGNTLDEAVNYLKENGIELFGINENPDQYSWTNSPKAHGHIYVDDANFGCPVVKLFNFNRPCVDWNIVGPAIVEWLLIMKNKN